MLLKLKRFVGKPSFVDRKSMEGVESNIPFALIGYEIGYCQLGSKQLIGYNIHHLVSHASE